MKVTHITELEKLQIIQLERTHTNNHNPAIHNEEKEIREDGLRDCILVMIDCMNDDERVHGTQCNSNLRFTASFQFILLAS